MRKPFTDVSFPAEHPATSVADGSTPTTVIPLTSRQGGNLCEIRLKRRITNGANRADDVTMCLDVELPAVPRTGDYVQIEIGVPVEVESVVYCANPKFDKPIVVNLKASHNGFPRQGTSRTFKNALCEHRQLGWQFLD